MTLQRVSGSERWGGERDVGRACVACRNGPCLNHVSRACRGLDRQPGFGEITFAVAPAEITGALLLERAGENRGRQGGRAGRGGGGGGGGAAAAAGGGGGGEGEATGRWLVGWLATAREGVLLGSKG